MAEQTGVQIATSLQQGPDGKQWVGVHVSAPLSTFAFAVPPDAALQLADGLPDMIRDTAAAARRANNGLMIATTIPGKDN